MATPEPSAVADDYTALRRGMAVAPLERDVVEVTGVEAETFLQGQLSQDVGAIGVGDGAWSFVLEPTGKVAALAHVVRASTDNFLVLVEGGAGDAVAARLNRFKLRTKAEIAVSDGWVAAAHPIGPEPRQHPVRAAGRVFTYVLGDIRYYVGEGPALAVGELPAVSPEAAEAWRIENGLPTMGAELVAGETIPAEAGQWLIDAAVSFTKGCYTGQELVARIDSRGGNVPRRLRGLVIDATADSGADAVPPAGAEVVVDDKVVGTLSSVAWSPGFERPIALASIGRAIEPPHTAELRWPGGSAAAVIEALPLQPPS